MLLERSERDTTAHPARPRFWSIPTPPNLLFLKVNLFLLLIGLWQPGRDAVRTKKKYKIKLRTGHSQECNNFSWITTSCRSSKVNTTQLSKRSNYTKIQYYTLKASKTYNSFSFLMKMKKKKTQHQNSNQDLFKEMKFMKKGEVEVYLIAIHSPSQHMTGLKRYFDQKRI